MKRNYYKIGLLFFLFFGLSGLQAQSLYVRPVTGVQSAYALANLRKLTFSGGNLVVTPNTGSNDTFALVVFIKKNCIKTSSNILIFFSCQWCNKLVYSV